VKVFACAIHESCTIGKRLGEHRLCAECPDFAPPHQGLALHFAVDFFLHLLPHVSRAIDHRPTSATS
jgi:hypothetical protein